MKADNIQEGMGAIRRNMVDTNVTIVRTETRVEDLQGGVGAIRKHMVDEKVSRQRWLVHATLLTIMVGPRYG
jgi:hypothetical protein